MSISSCSIPPVVPGPAPAPATGPIPVDPLSPPKKAKICVQDSTNSPVVDFFSGIGSGLASLVGLGSVVNPLGSLQSQLSKAQQNLNTISNTKGLVLADKTIRSNYIQYVASKVNMQYVEQLIALTTELTNEHFGKLDIVQMGLSLIMILVLMYLIFS